MAELKQRIEALLFIVTEGLKINDLAVKLQSNASDVEAAIKELKNDYSSRNSAVSIINYNDLYRMSVDRSFITNVNELVPQEFSQSLMKTLSVIAWKNGITQGEAVKIRGNKAYDHINKLKEYGFIDLEEYGKTFKLFLGDKFYEYFNIAKGQEKFIFNGQEDE